MTELFRQQRIASFVLAVIFALSLFSGSVYADDTEATYPSFELLSYLGIDKDVNTDNNAIITRAEFVAMAVRAANVAEIDVYDASFSDVSQGDLFAKEIYTAKKLRMTSGTAPNTFSPNGPMDIAAAQKMLVTALGYESYAVSLGGYPTGYAVVASKIGIQKGLEISGSLTVGDAKEMIINSLKADKAVIDSVSNGDISYSVLPGKNLLTENFNLTLINGIAKSAAYLSIFDTFENDNSIQIGSKYYKADFDVSKYFGKNINIWYDKVTKRIKAVEETDENKELVVSAKDAKYSGYKLSVIDNNGSTKTYTMEQNYTFVKNGRPIIPTSSDFKFENGTLRLIDNNSNGIYDIVVAEKIEYFVVKSKADLQMTVYDKDSVIKNICFDNNDELSYIIVDENGNRLDYDSIVLGSVLEVAKSDDAKVLVARISGAKAISGTVSEYTEISYTHNMSTYQAAHSITIDSVTYETTDYFKINHQKPVAGKAYDFLMSTDGKIVSLASSSATDMKYGYLLNYGTIGGIETSSKVKILTTENTRISIKLAETVYLDGVKMKYNDARINSAFKNGQYIKYQMLKYMLNDEGELFVIDTSPIGNLNTTWDIPDVYDEKDTLTQYLSKGSVNYRSGHNFGAPYFSFSKAYIFAIPQALSTTPDAEYDEELFYVMKSSDLVNNQNYTCDVYDMNEFYFPSAVAIYQSVNIGTTATPSSTSNSHVVYNVTDSVNPDGDVTKAIYTVSKGYYNRYYIDPDLLSGFEAGGLIPGKGDIVRLSLNVNNEIIGITIDASCSSSGTVTLNTIGSQTDVIAYISGKAIVAGGGGITLRVNQSPSSEHINSVAPIGLGWLYTYTFYNTTTGEVKVGSIDDIMTEKNSDAQSADFVVMRLNYYAATDVFIYTK